MLGKTSELKTEKQLIGDNLRKVFPNTVKVLQNNDDSKIVDPEEAEFDPQNEDNSNGLKDRVYNICKTGLGVGLVYCIVSKLDINLCQQLMSAFNATIQIMAQKRNQPNQGLAKKEPIPDISNELQDSIAYLKQLSRDILSPLKPKHSFAAFSRSIFPRDSSAELQPIYENVKKYNLDLAIAAFLYYFDTKESLDISTIQLSFEKSKTSPFLSGIDKKKFKLLSNLDVEILGDDEEIKPQPDVLYFYKDTDNTECPFLHLIHDEEAQIEHEFKHAHQILIKNIQLAVMTIPDKQSPFVPFLGLLSEAQKFRSPQDLIGYLIQFENKSGGQQIENYLLAFKPFTEYFRQFLLNQNAPSLPKQVQNKKQPQLIQADGLYVSNYADSAVKNSRIQPKDEEEFEKDTDSDEEKEFDPEAEQLQEERRKERKQRNEKKIASNEAKKKLEKDQRVSRERAIADLKDELQNDLGRRRIETLVRRSQMGAQKPQYN